MSTHHTQDANTAQQPSSGSHGGGLFSRIKAQAASALATVPQYNELEHYVRQASVQANPRQSPHTLPGVLAIKGLKGVIIDHDAVARETKNYSKNVLDYARVESLAPGHDVADIQDVGDRLAFLTYKAGELHAEHAKRLEAARIALKDVRNYENTINPHRERRHQLEREIGKLRTSSKPDTTTNKKIETLQAELDALIAPNSELSKGELEAASLKRRLLADSFNKQFDSMQELGEKLAIIAGYGKSLLKDFDTSPSAGKTDYVDGARTAAVRSGVEEALSSWDIRRPRIPAPTLNTGASNLHHAPSFHESHAGELASLHSVEDPAAAHKEALDSYYNQPPSPAALYQNQYGSGSSSNNNTNTSGSAPVGIPGAGSSSTSTGQGAPYTTSGASPLVQQLNTASVTNLPPPTMASSTSDRPSSSNSGAAGPSPIPVDASPMGSSLAPAPSLPTVAETGAPITGTGGPAKGVLGSPDNRSPDTSAAQSKQEEARQELNRRFEEYSGHNNASGSSIGGSGAGSGTGDNYSSELEREISLRARQGHETLPAYSAPGSDNKPPQ